MADVKKGKTPQEFFGGYTLLARRGAVVCGVCYGMCMLTWRSCAVDFMMGGVSAVCLAFYRLFYVSFNGCCVV